MQPVARASSYSDGNHQGTESGLIARTDLEHTDSAGRATLRTVASLAGVHVSTVSRALSPPRTGAALSMNPTAVRVRALAAELAYAPNPHAAGLRTSRSHLVGVLVPRLTDVVLATIYEGVEDAAAELGYHTFVATSRDSPRERALRTDLLLSRHVDGLILGDTPVDGLAADSLAAQDVPFILVLRRAGEHPSVTCNDEMGGRLVGEHLLSLGHRTPGVVAGPTYASTALDRTAGFLAAFAAAGRPVSKENVLHSGFDVNAGHDAAARLLATFPRPTALFAVNDDAAIGAIGAVREAGLRVGEDVAVIGYNDVPVVASLPVPMTTVRSPMHQMGRTALELLVARLGGAPVESCRLEPTLVVRASSGPPRH